MTSKINDRFKDAPWYVKCQDENIFVIGCGGISSNMLYYTCKTVPATYWIWDDDVVEEINVGSQFFFKNQIGKLKVEAMAETLQQGSIANVHTFNSKYNDESANIVITGLDNMKTRKQVYDVWKNNPSRELLIDGRLRANLYEIYVVTPGREELYEQTLFEDSEVDDGPCTFKQTAYFAGLIGSRIAHVLVNYLTNKYSEEPVCELPFSIKELGDLFYVKIDNYDTNTEEGIF